MAFSNLRIAGTGCGLGDIIYGDIDFNHDTVVAYHSRQPGDGGLEAGKLVFLDDLRRFSGQSAAHILGRITGSRGPDAFNAGGPALVSLALISQLLEADGVAVSYYGLRGRDTISGEIHNIIRQTPLVLEAFTECEGRTPSTYVLSDPRLNQGQGERTFINDIGVCADFDIGALNNGFFDAAFNLYGGTALVPPLHQALPGLLKKGRGAGAVNIVGTVFDFSAEKQNPQGAWGLGGGGSFEALKYSDLLITDYEEVLRITGQKSFEAAVAKAFDEGLLSLVVTRGAEPVFFKSVGGLFGHCQGTIPVNALLSARVGDRTQYPGDTTGAGDNFLGGMVYSLAAQVIRRGDGGQVINREDYYCNPFNMIEAIETASIAGGLACLQYGGVYLEKFPGDKLSQIRAVQRS